jgi:hypothetical protein
MTKTGAVQAVFDEGITKPLEVSARVKEKYGLDVPPNHVSTIKTQLKKRQGKSVPGRKREQQSGALTHESVSAAIEYVQKVGGLEAAEDALNLIRTARDL